MHRNSLLRHLRGLISYSTPWTCQCRPMAHGLAAVPNDTEANLLSRMGQACCIQGSL